MPIKTMNNNGLQVLEETEDYTIYIDKDAVFTTVQKYAPGTYQEFSDRKSLIDSNAGLMKSYNITWSTQDDVNLINEINDKALKKLEEQPMMLPVDLEETPNEIQVLSARAVPVTYECCFRMDKKSGEFYIGEGYENLFAVNKLVTPINFTEINSSSNHYKVTKIAESAYGNHGALNLHFSMNLNETISISYEVKNISITKECRIETRISSPNIIYDFLNKKSFESNSYTFSVNRLANEILVFSTAKEFSTQQEFEFRKAQITKTNTTKPWVKTIQPTCKLDRISNANETTHTFLNKGDGVITFGNGYFSLKGDNIQQFLVYKGILTEEQKQIELNKTFKVR